MTPTTKCQIGWGRPISCISGQISDTITKIEQKPKIGKRKGRKTGRYGSIANAMEALPFRTGSPDGSGGAEYVLHLP